MIPAIVAGATRLAGAAEAAGGAEAGAAGRGAGMARGAGAAAKTMKARSRGNPATAGDKPGVWDRIGWLQLMERALDESKSFLPSFNHSIQVAIAGGPQADIRRIWYLCCAAVFGRFRNRVRTAFTPVSLDATWDISNKVVSLEINYWGNQLVSSGLYDAVMAGGGAAGALAARFIGGRLRAVPAGIPGPRAGGLADPTASGMALLLRGPEQLTVGAGFTTTFVPPVFRIADSVAGIAGAVVDSFVEDAGLGNARPAWSSWLSDDRCVKSHISTVRVYPTVRADTAINVLREWPTGAQVTGPRGVLIVGSYPYNVTVPLGQPATVGPTSLVPDLRVLPTLPDEGRVITTVEKLDSRVQPPKPPVDGNTRVSLLGLVAQSLQYPCFLPDSPPCTGNPAAGAGLYVTAGVSSPSSTEPSDLAELWSGRLRFPGSYPVPPTAGPDGYPLGSRSTVSYGD